jgi:hypothetical protein
MLRPLFGVPGMKWYYVNPKNGRPYFEVGDPVEHPESDIDDLTRIEWAWPIVIGTVDG